MLLRRLDVAERYLQAIFEQFNPDDPQLSQARLFLARVLKDAIAGGLELLGVNAPARM